MNRDRVSDNPLHHKETEPAGDECLWGKPGHLEQLRKQHPDVDEDTLVSFVAITAKLVEREKKSRRSRSCG